MRLRLTIDVDLHESPTDAEEMESLKDILYQRGDAANDQLILHSNFIGDEIGMVTVQNVEVIP